MKEFLNVEKKRFKDLTGEQMKCIVDAKLNGTAEFLGIDSVTWYNAGNNLTSNIEAIYRTKPAKKLDIPWHLFKKKWQWAAFDEDGEVRLFEKMPLKPDYENYWIDVSDAKSLSELLEKEIDIDGIDWKESLVQRPEGGLIDENNNND